MAEAVCCFCQLSPTISLMGPQTLSRLGRDSSATFHSPFIFRKANRRIILTCASIISQVWLH